MFDFTAVGELLIDFTPEGRTEAGHPRLGQNPGGAPANVAVALTRLGHKTAFVGKVGADAFGDFLRGVLKEAGVDTGGLIRDTAALTTLAFVHLSEQGERTFTFSRGADALLTPEELPDEQLEETRIVHFGSVSLSREPSAAATLEAVRFAKYSGAIVSFDPNVRLGLWSSAEACKRAIQDGMPFADMVKVSEEELHFLTGSSDPAEGSQMLYERYGTPLVWVTLGERGSFYRRGDLIGSHDGFRVNAVDTTGAGDAFWAGVLDRVLANGGAPDRLTEEQLQEAAAFANAAGALATTKKGAIPALPTRAQIETLVRS